jgi:hypothetical protein
MALVNNTNTDPKPQLTEEELQVYSSQKRRPKPRDNK